MLFGKSFTKIVIIDFSSHYFFSEEKMYFILFTTEEKTSCLFFPVINGITEFTILTTLECKVLWHKVY